MLKKPHTLNVTLTLWACAWGECRGKQVALDAARGLAYLHRKRIAWLDCKSSNVLLTKCAPPPPLSPWLLAQASQWSLASTVGR